jgi:hypothetical protein
MDCLSPQDRVIFIQKLQTLLACTYVLLDVRAICAPKYVLHAEDRVWIYEPVALTTRRGAKWRRALPQTVTCW